MKKTLYIITALLSAALTLSCRKEVPFSVDECQQEYSFEAEGGTVFATVFGSGKFSVESSQEWCYVQAYTPGQDNNLRITARENSNAQSREAVVTVSCEGQTPVLIKVTQGAADAFINFDPASISLEEEDTGFTLNVNANTPYTVGTPDWVSFDDGQECGIGTFDLQFSLIGACPKGTRRKGNVTLSSETLTVQVYVEQVALEMETVTMMWGLEDIQYIWDAFSKSTAAVTPSVVETADFSSYPKLTKVDDNMGFIYTNDSGALTVALASSGQFKIGKASSKSSKGNIDRDGNNVERMQLNKATAGVAENAFVFTAPRGGSLEIEAAAPNTGDKKPMVMVDGADYMEFTAENGIPSNITTMDIPVADPENGAEVRIYGTGGAINYFRITYTYKRPKEIAD